MSDLRGHLYSKRPQDLGTWQEGVGGGESLNKSPSLANPSVYVTCDKEFNTSEKVPVNLLSKVDFPTDGKPTKPTRASPLFVTSNPSPAPPPPFDEGSNSSLRSFASLAWHHMINQKPKTKRGSKSLQ